MDNMDDIEVMDAAGDGGGPFAGVLAGAVVVAVAFVTAVAAAAWLCAGCALVERLPEILDVATNAVPVVVETNAVPPVVPDAADLDGEVRLDLRGGFRAAIAEAPDGRLAAVWDVQGCGDFLLAERGADGTWRCERVTSPARQWFNPSVGYGADGRLWVSGAMWWHDDPAWRGTGLWSRSADGAVVRGTFRVGKPVEAAPAVARMVVSGTRALLYQCGVLETVECAGGALVSRGTVGVTGGDLRCGEKSWAALGAGGLLVVGGDWSCAVARPDGTALRWAEWADWRTYGGGSDYTYCCGALGDDGTAWAALGWDGTGGAFVNVLRTSGALLRGKADLLRLGDCAGVGRSAPALCVAGGRCVAAWTLPGAVALRSVGADGALGPLASWPGAQPAVCALADGRVAVAHTVGGQCAVRVAEVP